MKKWAILLFVILLNILSVQAINLDISSEPISNTYVIELDEPAVFDLTIRNLEEDDKFEIYSLVGIDISPERPIGILSGDTRKIEVELMPQDSLKVRRESPFTFEYKIKNSKNEIQDETLSINIIDLESAFLISPQPITPKSDSIIISIKNNFIREYPEVSIRMTSGFFDSQKSISLNPKEVRELTVLLDKEKLKTFDAGNYLMNSEVTINGKTANVESQIKFLEQEGIETSESKEGFIVQRTEIIRKNSGNIRKNIQVTSELPLYSSFFTTTNIPPTKTETRESKKIYTWEKELIPNEELKIIIKTNWYFPIIILIIIIFAIAIIRRAAYTDLDLSKKVSFVKTKGGQFALRVTLKVKAKKYIERINIRDKLPPLVQLYNKFGIIEPSKIDTKNKRLEWDLPSMNKEESRILTYIIYSKIGVVGRFELPEAKAIYEREGQIKETASNKSFYINEPDDN